MSALALDCTELRIPMAAYAGGEWSAKNAQARHRLRWLKQRLQRPQVGIIGGYHFGNLGDMCLGQAVLRRVKARGLSGGLQTIHNLQRWPRTRFAIVGGGAVGYEDCLARLREAYQGFPKRVAILGVDFNDPGAVQRNAAFLDNVATITCRSEAQAARLMQLLHRADISWHPDLTFSFYSGTPVASEEASPSRPVFGITCAPFLLRQLGDRFVPGTDFIDEFRREHPSLEADIPLLARRYCELARGVCERAAASGMTLRHFPFAPVDDLVARTILSGLDVEFVPYSTNLDAVLLQMQKCSRFFTTRYHSLIFSLLSHCAVTPFCYASKCDQLLTDLKVGGDHALRVKDLASDRPSLAEEAFAGGGLTVSPSILIEASQTSRDAIDQAVAFLARQ